MPELSSITNVKSQLGITVTTWDTELTAILNAAEVMIADWCDRRDNSAGMVATESRWISATHTENIPGALQRSVALRFWPVTAITSVTVYGANSTSSVVSSSTYRIDADQRTLKFGGSYQAGWELGLVSFQNIPPYMQPIDPLGGAYPYTAVVYTGGFGSGTVPLSLQQAAIELTSRIFQKRKRDTTLTGESLGEYSWTGGGAGQWQEYKDEFMATYLSAYAGVGGGIC